jgi:acetyl-CoA acetyltransferase
MGNCAEKCAVDYNLSREDQDAYAIESYRRAAAASEAGKVRAIVAAHTHHLSPPSPALRLGPHTGHIF